MSDISPSKGTSEHGFPLLFGGIGARDLFFQSNPLNICQLPPRYNEIAHHIPSSQADR